jgi:hypothetical protein
MKPLTQAEQVIAHLTDYIKAAERLIALSSFIDGARETACSNLLDRMSQARSDAMRAGYLWPTDGPEILRRPSRYPDEDWLPPTFRG